MISTSRLDFVLDGEEFPKDIKEMFSSIIREYGKVRVIVEPLRPKRSADQNRLFMLFVRRLSLQAGMSVEDMKETVKKYAMDMGYPILRAEDGSISVDERGNFIPLPTHLATTAQFNVLIEACEQIAYENGLKLEV